MIYIPSAASLAASIVYRVGSFLYSRMFEQFPLPFHIDPWDVVQDLLYAAVFAFAFWGGLALFAPGWCAVNVLRD